MYNEYFRENGDIGYLQKLMNKKSNILLNLDKFKGEKKKIFCSQAGNIELEIINELNKKDDLKEQSKSSLMHNSLISAVNVLIDFFPKKAYKILLKGLSDDNFDNKSKRIFFARIKELRMEKKDEFLVNDFRFFNFLIKRHVDNSLKINKQRFNKFELYVFDKLNYPDIFSINLDLHPRTISYFPLYSPELREYLKKIIKMKILMEKDKFLFPHVYYKVSEKQAEYFINNTDAELIKKIDKTIADFSKFNSKKIIEWEKNLKFLNYFEIKDTF